MDYKPNSNRFKEQQKEAETEKKKIQKVTTGKVKIKKKTGLQKMAGAMFAEDAEKVKTSCIGLIVSLILSWYIFDCICWRIKEK